MTNVPTQLIVNCTTGEQTIVPLTPEEIAQNEIDSIHAQNEKTRFEAEMQAKAKTKASALAKLAALGLSEEEAAAIAGA
jgi:hypothetical protein